jgi:hypothetical protein
LMDKAEITAAAAAAEAAGPAGEKE